MSLPREGAVEIPARFPMQAQDEVWSLDYTIANFVLPRLKYFRLYPGGTPGGFDRHADWLNALDKMIAAFELLAMGSWNIHKRDDLVTVDDGLALFSRHFMSLWN